VLLPIYCARRHHRVGQVAEVDQDRWLEIDYHGRPDLGVTPARVPLSAGSAHRIACRQCKRSALLSHGTIAAAIEAGYEGMLI
jgi:hypothetical protein